MGAWGTAIFSDDIAEEVRNNYKDLIADGKSSEEATNILVGQYLNAEDNDEDDTIVFWLSLAAIQWKLGRLQNSVSKRALEIIDNGSDLKRWEEEPSLLKKREKVLLKLKQQLNSPQPLEKKVPKRFIPQTNLKVKDAISYRLQSGKYIILKVLSIEEERDGSRYPIFEICDWIGGKPSFNKKEIETLPLLKSSPRNIKNINLAIFPEGKRDYPEDKITLLAENVEISQEQTQSFDVLSWKTFNKELEEGYYKFSFS